MNKEIIDKTIAALRHNHFEAFFAHNTAEASAIFFRDIFPGLQVETVSWGDSETMKATGVLNEFIIGKTKCERYKKRNAIIRV